MEARRGYWPGLVQRDFPLDHPSLVPLPTQDLTCIAMVWDPDLARSHDIGGEVLTVGSVILIRVSELFPCPHVNLLLLLFPGPTKVPCSLCIPTALPGHVRGLVNSFRTACGPHVPPLSHHSQGLSSHSWVSTWNP